MHSIPVRFGSDRFGSLQAFNARVALRGETPIGAAQVERSVSVRHCLVFGLIHVRIECRLSSPRRYPRSVQYSAVHVSRPAGRPAHGSQENRAQQNITGQEGKQEVRQAAPAG